MWYPLAGVAGLIAGAYACLGMIILIAPSMGSEDIFRAARSLTARPLIQQNI